MRSLIAVIAIAITDQIAIGKRLLRSILQRSIAANEAPRLVRAMDRAKCNRIVAVNNF